jgi:hypothetical protein
MQQPASGAVAQLNPTPRSQDPQEERVRGYPSSCHPLLRSIPDAPKITLRQHLSSLSPQLRPLALPRQEYLAAHVHSTCLMKGRVGRPMLTRSMAGGAAEPFVSLAERVRLSPAGHSSVDARMVLAHYLSPPVAPQTPLPLLF